MYHDMMMDNIDEVTDKTIQTLKYSEKDRARVGRPYNKVVESKSFQVRDLIKTIVPFRMKSIKLSRGHQARKAY